ncbi:MAG: O-antigen ligase family protein [Bacteroidota bacterium]
MNKLPEERLAEKPATPSLGHQLRSSRLPILFWVTLITTLIACTFTGEAFFFYTISGFAWIVTLAFAGMFLTANLTRVTFPIRIWLPWMLIVFFYSYLSEYTNLQRSIMIVCPVIVGIAASTARVTDKQLESVFVALKIFAFALFIIIAFITGLLLTGVLPKRTSLAPQSITALFFCSIFVSGYSFGFVKDIFWYGLVSFIPIIALVRGAIVVAGLSLPLSFSPQKIQVRFIMLVLVSIGGLALFYTDRVQSKMFIEGKGTVDDLTRYENVATHGRRYMAEMMTVEIAKDPWLGHGANASEDFVVKLTAGQLTHPHNDWLRLLYDYGIFGTAIFTITISAQVINLLRRGRSSDGNRKVLFYACASSFLSQLFIMFTDNILLYAAFFGNIQFVVIGLAYAADRREMREREPEEDEQQGRGRHRRSRSTRERHHQHTAEDREPMST